MNTSVKALKQSDSRFFKLFKTLITYTKSSFCVLSLLLILLVLPRITNAQYFQQKIKYNINASLDTTTHSIKGTCRITYTNNAPQSIDTIFIHLWANAFSEKLTAYSEQAIKNGQLDFYFNDERDLGGYNNLNISIDSKRLTLYRWNNNPDVVYFLSPKTIKQGETVNIHTHYTLQLPKFYSRIGHKRHDDYLTYWYPTPAVYDNNGWHPMPYLGAGETYNEIADFNIEIDIPYKNVIASTIPTKIEDNKYTYSAQNRIDFALISSKNKEVTNFELSTDLTSSLKLKVMSKSSERAQSIKKYIESALPFFENWIGPFPYNSLSIIDKGIKSKNGMEYPGLITVGGVDGKASNLEFYVIHELLHQWFYSSLAFDQRSFAWLDEGLTTYYQQRYYQERYGVDHYSNKGKRFLTDNHAPILQTIAKGQAKRCFHQSLSVPIDSLDIINYGLNAYEIPARLYAYLADYLDQKVFDKAMQTFYIKWKTKHPSPKIFKQHLEKETSKDLSWLFDGMINHSWAYDYKIKNLENNKLYIEHISGASPPYKISISNDQNDYNSLWIEGHKDVKIIDLPDGDWSSIIIDKDLKSMDINSSNNYYNTSRPYKIITGIKVDDARYKSLYLLPFLSYNTSDGGQIGGVLFNSTFPEKKLSWLINPSYGIGSKKIIGEFWINYNQYLKTSVFRKLDYHLNLKSYSYRNSESLSKGLRYTRLSPEITFHIKHKPTSASSSKLYAKTIILNEERFVFEGEEVYIKNCTNNIFRLGYNYQNNWALGPSNLLANIEYYPYKNVLLEKHNYIKLTLDYNKSFMYSPKKSLNFRFWGGYFITNTQRESSNFDGSITKGSFALIHQGFNDYAYDEYYINRANQNSKFANQISQLGGGFKTPMGSQYKIGQSNDLAYALNITGDFPIKLPKLLPIKFFLDFGYYSSKGTSSEQLIGKNIYSGGVLLSYGKGLFTIHLPLFNSDNISEIYKTEGTTTLNKVSFKINLMKFNPWKMLSDNKRFIN